ncbi:glucosamine 6-phosphate N-acetyltransferase [Rhodotorula paludigena]|uniref:glucosamine 6-phosphate N-acetyltransferase n=1 Tax=Rhodotorula paludigena TaxID=86838 RepID=UPI0031812589
MPAAASELLYSDEHIPAELRASLPAGLTLRPLASTDYARGHLSLLAHLTASPDVGAEAWAARFRDLERVNAAQLTYLPIVIVDDAADRLVAQATVVVERKFLRGAGLVGHVEDVVVDPSMQGKKLGLKLIEVLTAMSEKVGAYKTILDCDPKNESFYAKCGYENKGCEMAKYKE